MNYKWTDLFGWKICINDYIITNSDIRRCNHVSTSCNGAVKLVFAQVRWNVRAGPGRNVIFYSHTRVVVLLRLRAHPRFVVTASQSHATTHADPPSHSSSGATLRPHYHSYTCGLTNEKRRNARYSAVFRDNVSSIFRLSSCTSTYVLVSYDLRTRT